MKKICRITAVLLYLALIAFIIVRALEQYSDELLLFLVISIEFFLVYAFLKLMPKKVFDLCWKRKKHLGFDYETSYRALPKIATWMFVIAVLFSVIALALTI